MITTKYLFYVNIMQMEVEKLYSKVIAALMC